MAEPQQELVALPKWLVATVAALMVALSSYLARFVITHSDRVRDLENNQSRVQLEIQNTKGRVSANTAALNTGPRYTRDQADTDQREHREEHRELKREFLRAIAQSQLPIMATLEALASNHKGHEQAQADLRAAERLGHIESELHQLDRRIEKLESER